MLNGGPGLLISDPDGRLLSAMTLEVASGRVVGINSVVNPDKLGHLGPVGDMRAMLRGAR